MRILLVGEESAGVMVLRSLLTTNHLVVAVLTGRSTGTRSTLAGAAAQFGLPVRSAEVVRDERFADWLASERVDLLLNIHSLFLVHPDALAVPTIGCFNLHPGPLPRYAGLNAPSWAIYHGEERHGTTVHWMTENIDAGPIAYQALFDIAPDDTGLSVTMKCVRLGVPLISRVVQAAVTSQAAIPRIEQDPLERTYFPPGPPDGGRVSWRSPARRVVDFIRAADYAPFASPWGHPVTAVRDHELELTKASLTGEPTNGAAPGMVAAIRNRGVLVAAADEWVLLDRVRARGTASWASEVLRPGMRLRS